MKKLFITTILFLFTTIALNAQLFNYTISGYVTDLQTGAAVNNHAVYISGDSTNGPAFNYWHMVYTNANGYYVDTVPVVSGTQAIYNVFTTDCNNIYNATTVVSTNLPMTADFSICTGGGTITCAAGFVFTPDSVNSGVSSATINFTDITTGYPTTWMWDFGDGSTSSFQNPVHTYQNAGTYNVCLVISTSNGCSSTFCDSVIAGTGNPVACQADFYAFQDSTQLAYYFYDYSTGVSNTTNYLWDFGDGTFSLLQYPYHQYANTGVYMVCLTISDSMNNCASTYCDSILVDSSNVYPCYGAFQYTTNNTDVNFYGYSNCGSSVSYLWDFGDSTSGTGQNPIHTYNNFGTYTVCLSITGNGAISTTCQTVVCAPVTNNSLCGQVFADANILDAGEVYLIGTDSLANSYNYFASTYVDSSGYYCFYNVPVGLYIIVANPSYNSLYYNDYLPTYYGDVLYWSDATLVSVGLGNLTGLDINLVSTAGPVAGNGSISGNVIQAGSKLVNTGDPIENVEILLLDNSDNPLAATYSDANGNFSFTGLALGTYKIYGEYAGLQATAAVVELTSNSTSIDNVQVNVGSGTIIASVEELLSEYIASVSNIYPNPATTQFNFSISALKCTEISISVVDMYGKHIYSNVVSASVGMNTISINASNYAAGVYSLQLKTNDGTLISRKIQKIR